MRYYPLLDFQLLVLAFFTGLALLVALFMAWGGYSKRAEKEGEREGEGPPDGSETPPVPGAEENPIPPFVLLIYAGVMAAVGAYVVIVGIFGGPIG